MTRRAQVAEITGRSMSVARSLLARARRAGWIESTWRQTENSRRAKYYSLTRAGERRLEAETEDWRRRSLAMGRLLGAEG